MSDWTHALSKALAAGDRKSLATPDYRFVEYPYQRPGWERPHVPQNAPVVPTGPEGLKSPRT